MACQGVSSKNTPSFFVSKAYGRFDFKKRKLVLKTDKGLWSFATFSVVWLTYSSKTAKPSRIVFLIFSNGLKFNVDFG